MRKYLTVILMLGLLASGLLARAEDKPTQPEKASVQWSRQDVEPYCPDCTMNVTPQATKCPNCNAEFTWAEPEFENTAEWALFKLRYALKYNNEKLFKESSVDEKMDAYKDNKIKDKLLSPCITIKTEEGDNGKSFTIYFVVKEKDVCKYQKAKLVKDNEVWKVNTIADSKPPKGSNRMAANEATAMGSLKALQAAEAIWRQTAMSGTGKTDYWTYDVSGFYRMMKAGAPCAVITLDLAKSDAAFHKDGVFGENVTANWKEIASTLGPKAGYWVKMLKESAPGKPYNQNVYAGSSVACANDYLFGICVFPSEYGVTGVRTFILNERGVTYWKDLGPMPETRVRKKTIKGKPDLDQEKRIKELISQLGADDWEVREKAQETLTKMGKPARELLEKEKDSTEPEIKMRVNRILKDIGLQDKKEVPGGIECWPDTDPTTKGWSCSGD